LFVFLLRDQAQPTGIAKILIDAEVEVQAERLREIAHLRTSLARRGSENPNFSASLRQHAGDDFECGCLTRAIRADKAEDLSRPYLETDLVQGFQRAIAFRQ